MKRAYCDVVAYDMDLIAPARESRVGTIALAVVAGILMGLIGPHPKLPPAPRTYERESREIERLRAELKVSPWKRALAAREAEGLPPWDTRHSE